MINDSATKELLQAPCLFCQYNGQGYWQSGSHPASCPWSTVGGIDSRYKLFRQTLGLVMRNRMFQVLKQQVISIITEEAKNV